MIKMEEKWLLTQFFNINSIITTILTKYNLIPALHEGIKMDISLKFLSSYFSSLQKEKSMNTFVLRVLML